MANYNSTYRIGFEADTTRFKQDLAQLQTELRRLGTMTTSHTEFTYLTKEFAEASSAAAELEQHIKSAVNVNTGKLDLAKFSASLKQSGKSLDVYRQQLTNLGPAGVNAFNNITKAIIDGETPLKRSSLLLDKLATTFKNTVRWQISNAAINAFTGSLSTAYRYSQDLNKSLSNIRVITNKNTADLAQFAEQANQAAKALSTTTVDYSNASLIYYQQGLNDEQVQERADITVKLANVTRQSAEDVSSQMTAIWNNFNDGVTSLEYYADVITKLGATTASSSSEIAEGLEKFASVANTVGLSYEYATAALATVVAETRQSADTVGTAFRTLFARLQDLEQGNVLDDGTTLGQYAEALYKVGVNVKTTSGGLKDMDSILDELGQKWTSLTQAEQVALAEAVAGTRQYDKFMAIMSNWDKITTNIEVASNATGELVKQNDLYAESWEAANNRVRASAEAIYNSLIDDKFFINLDDKVIVPILNNINLLVKSLGGMGGVLNALGLLGLRAFKDNIAKGIQLVGDNIDIITKRAEKRILEQFAAARDAQQEAATLSIAGSGEQKIHAMLAEENSLRYETYSIVQKLSDSQKALIQAEDNKLRIARERAENSFSELSAQEDITNELRMQISLAPRAQGYGHISNLSEASKKLFDKRNYRIDNFGGNEHKQETAVWADLKTTTAAAMQAEQLTEKLQLLKNANVQDAAAIQATEEQLRKLAESQSVVKIETDDLNTISQQFSDTSVNLSEILSVMFGRAPEQVQQYVNALVELERRQINAEITQAEYNKEVQKYIQLIEQSRLAKFSFADQINATANAAMTLSMTMNSISSFKDILSDNTLSSWERLSRLLMSISMLVPAITLAQKAYNVVSLASTAAHAAYTAQLKVGTVATARFAAAQEFLNLTLMKNPLLLAVTIVAATIAIIKWSQSINGLAQSQERLNKATEEYNKTKEDLTNLENELDGVIARIKELNDLPIKSLTDQQELSDLTIKKELLEAQVELQKELLKLKQQEQAAAIVGKAKEGGYTFTPPNTPKTQQDFVQKNAVVKAFKDNNPDNEFLQHLDRYTGGDVDQYIERQQEKIKAAFGKINPTNDSEAQIYEQKKQAALSALDQLQLDLKQAQASDFIQANTETYSNNVADYLALQSAYAAGTISQEDYENTSKEILKGNQQFFANAYGEGSGKYYSNLISSTFQNTDQFESYLKDTLQGEDIKFDSASLLQYMVDEDVLNEYLQKIQKDLAGKINPQLINELSTDELLILSQWDDPTGTKLETLDDAKTKIQEITEATDQAVERSQNLVDNFKTIAQTLTSIKYGDTVNEKDMSAIQAGLADVLTEEELINFNNQFVQLADGTYKFIGSEQAMHQMVANLANKSGEEVDALRKKLALTSTSVAQLNNNFGQNKKSDTYRNGLKAIASQYVNCQDELQNYINAIGTADEESARLALEEAVRVEEAKKKYTEGISALKSTFDELEKYTDQSSKAYNQELSSIAQTFKDTFHINLSEEDIKKNISLIKRISKGGEDGWLAYQELVNRTVTVSNDEINEIIKNAGIKLSEEITVSDDQLTELTNKKRELLITGTADFSSIYNQLLAIYNDAKIVSQLLGGITGASIETTPEFKLIKSSEWSMYQSLGYEKAGSYSDEATQYLVKRYKITGKLDTPQDTFTGPGNNNPTDSTAALKDRAKHFTDINNEIEEQTRLFSKLQTALERAYGVSKIAKFQDVIDSLNDELSLQQKKVIDADKYLEDDRKTIEQYAKALGVTAVFDEQTQRLTNYEELQNAAADAYNASIRSAGANSSKNKKNSAKNTIKDSYDALTDALSNYNEDWTERLNALDRSTEIAREIADKKLEQINTTLELHISTKDAEKQLNEFLTKIKTTFSTNEIADVGTNLLNSIANAKLEGEKIDVLKTSLTDLQALIKDPNVDKSQLADQLGNLRDKAIESAEAVMDTIQTIKEALPNALKEATIEIERFTKQIDHNAKTLSTLKEIVELDGSNRGVLSRLTSLSKVIDGQLKTSQVSLTTQIKEASELEEAYKEAEQFLDEQTKGTTAYEIALANRDALYDEYTKAQEAMMQTAVDTINIAKEKMDTALQQAAAKFESTMTNGSTFDALQTTYDHFIDENERYLDSVERYISTTQLNNKLQSSLDAATSASAKNMLSQLQDEFALRQAQTDLSQYDLEIMNAKYEMTLKQIALEEAQNAKSSARLVRNASGNYTYAFTADQDNINKAEDDLLAAQQNYYKLTKDESKRVSSELIKVWQEALNKVQEIQNNTALTDEQKEKQITDIKKYYYDKVKDLNADLSKSTTDMKDASIMTMGEYDAFYANTLVNMTTSTADFETEFDKYIKQCQDVANDYKKTIADVEEEVGVSFDNMQEQVDDLTEASETLGKEAVKAIEDAADEISKIEDIIEANEDWYNSLKNVVKMYKQVATAAQQAISSTSSTSPDVADKSLAVAQAANKKNYSSAQYYLSQRDDTDAKVSNTAIQKVLDAAQDPKNTHYKEAQDIINQIANNGKLWNDYKDKIATFATGGYTGAWSESGKLALLHEKELVLNQQDTENILTAVSAVRDIPPSIISMIAQFLNNSASNAIAALSNRISATGLGASIRDTIQQIVSIDANFPNVESANEIEAALHDLINNAAQYANRKF